VSAGREAWSLGRLYGKLRQVLHHQRTVTLKPASPQVGRVLLSYIHEPFLQPGKDLPTSHTHYWESVQMANTFLELGFVVDVMSYHNRTLRPRHHYDLFIDARWNLERLADRLPADCIRVMHIDTAHMTFQNAAESRRLLELQQRRGITLQPRRFERPNLGIEFADCGVVIGNAFTTSTFAYAGKPLHPVPMTSVVTFAAPSGRDFDRARRRFVWLGSGGMVHKGLDLTLEVFARNPDLQLTVCGPVEREADFARAYHRELYQTENITTLGWVDVASTQFREVLQSSVGLVYPSCSEGQSGAVVLCMHAGLIPICTRESGLDIADKFGIELTDASPDTIEAAVRSIAERPATELNSMAMEAWRVARTRHSREAFSTRHRHIMTSLLGGGRTDVLRRPLGPVGT
jgi:hypothetical protein